MRVDHIAIENFKGFSRKEFRFSPNFNLIVGTNGTGKTSALDALAVAVGSWFLGMRGHESRSIRNDEVRLFCHQYKDDITFEQQFPSTIAATGNVLGQVLSWERSLESELGRTRFQNAIGLKSLGSNAYKSLIEGETPAALPLIAYYGTGRLSRETRAKIRRAPYPRKRASLSRLVGYRNCIDPKISTRAFVEWFANQSWIGYQKGEESFAFRAIKRAIVRCVEGAKDLFFDPRLGEVVVIMAGQRTQPFANLSDGQRCMLAMVGDIARKAIQLNPQFGRSALTKTSGVVLIDELDLHLHPRWQRGVIENLRNSFPKIQFICTTHSPFLIQSLRSSEELLVLDGQPTTSVANLSIDDIARSIMGIERPDVAERYSDMLTAAKTYLQTLEDAPAQPGTKLERYKDELAKGVGMYAENPAYQAFLELKRVAKIGE